MSDPTNNSAELLKKLSELGLAPDQLNEVTRLMTDATGAVTVAEQVDRYLPKLKPGTRRT